MTYGGFAGGIGKVWDSVSQYQGIKDLVGSSLQNGVGQLAQSTAFGRNNLNVIDSTPLSIPQAAVFGSGIGGSVTLTNNKSTPWYKMPVVIVGFIVGVLTILFLIFNKRKKR